jgi:hypothetical protein
MGFAPPNRTMTTPLLITKPALKSIRQTLAHVRACATSWTPAHKQPVTITIQDNVIPPLPAAVV